MSATSQQSESVAMLVRQQQHRVIELARFIIVAVAVPGIFVFAALDWHAEQGSVWLLAEIAAITVMAVVLLIPRSTTYQRAMVFVVCMNVVSVMALFHYGPLMGTGLFLVSATLSGTFFFGRAGAVASSATMVAAIVFSAIAVPRGWITPEYVVTDPVSLLRLSIATGAGLLGCTFLFKRVQDAMRRSIDVEVAARERQREVALESERILRSAMATQRLESLGRLAGGVAHDINNALVIIQSGIDILRVETDCAARDDLLTDITTGVSRATSTIRRLMTFSRSPELSDSCVPSEVLEQFVSSIRRYFPASIDIRIDAEPTPSIQVPAGSLDQALLNLALNARDAMASAGCLELSCRFDAASKEVVITVADDGVGIDLETKERLFEPFYTTKEEYGTGLGLAMVWWLVSQHHGTIDVDSSPGEGARFELRFPEASAVQIRHVVPRIVKSNGPRPSANVLLVEDEGDVRSLMHRLLERSGYKVTSVENISDAHRALDLDAYSVLVTDAVFADGSVQELIEAFTAACPDAGVLICSGHDIATLGLDDSQRQGVRFLPKPFAMNELIGTLRDLTNGGTNHHDER